MTILLQLRRIITDRIAVYGVVAGAIVFAAGSLLPPATFAVVATALLVGLAGVYRLDHVERQRDQARAERDTYAARLKANGVPWPWSIHDAA